MKPSKRLTEAAKQTRIAHDQLNDLDDDEVEELPEGVIDQIGEISERIRRARHALYEVDR